MSSAAEYSVAFRYELEGIWKEAVEASIKVYFGQWFKTP
jgi:hypothetical protein